MADPTPITAPAKSKPRGSNFSIEQGQSGFNSWTFRMAESNAFDDVLEPAFWANVAPDLFRGPFKGAGDTIHVISFDCSMRGTLSVVAAAETWLKVGWLHEPKSVIKEVATVAETSPLVTKWNVGLRAYDVVRKSDKQVIKGGFALKEDANGWIAQHLKAMAA